MSLNVSFIFIVTVFWSSVGLGFCSILQYYFFHFQLLLFVSRCLKDILLMLSINLHNIPVFIVEYKEFTHQTELLK
jgi:hypothetical protein